MLKEINFFSYRLQVAFYFLEFVDDMGFWEAFRYSRDFRDFWEDEMDPFDAVLEELSNWND